MTMTMRRRMDNGRRKFDFSPTSSYFRNDYRQRHNNSFSSTLSLSHSFSTKSFSSMDHVSNLSSESNHANTNINTNINTNTNNDNIHKNMEVNLQMDFFGEPITFFLTNNNNQIQNTMESIDAFLLTIASRGKLASGGGDEHGIEMAAAHSSSIAWSNLLQNIDQIMNDNNNNGNFSLSCSSPMAVATLLSPLLAQCGSAYVHSLDREYLSQVNYSSSSTSSSTSLSSSSNRDVQTNSNSQTKRGRSLLQWGKDAVAQTVQQQRQDVTNLVLSRRETAHLKALHHLLRDEHRDAMHTLFRLLHESPGDLLALLLILDIACHLGEKEILFRAATTIASYWTERGGGGGSTNRSQQQPGHALGMSTIATCLSINGRYKEAEQFCNQSQTFQDMEGTSGSSTWALAHSYDAEGRVSEGVSLLSGYDGMASYRDCGFLFFDSRLAAMGARFTYDRDGANADRVALRLYDHAFDRVMKYSGYTATDDDYDVDNDDEHNILPLIRSVPKGKGEVFGVVAGGAAKSFIGSLFGDGGGGSGAAASTADGKASNNTPGQNKKMEEEEGEDMDINRSSHGKQGIKPVTFENIFCWLPPTPQFLTDATFLLLRLTFGGAIEGNDPRWKGIKQAWKKVIYNEIQIQKQQHHHHQQQQQYQPEEQQNQSKVLLKFSPMARIASSLVVDDVVLEHAELCNKDNPLLSTQLEQCSHLIGKLLKLGMDNGQCTSTSTNDNDNNTDMDEDVHENHHDDTVMTKEWIYLSHRLADIRDGRQSPENNDDHGNSLLTGNTYFVQDIHGWDSTLRPFLEHSTFHAARNSADDPHALNLARAVCSEGVSLRPNSPETWWRYSIILEKLGDLTAAEDALATSVSLGSGEGGRVGGGE